jgi:hypothetical protein
MRVYVAKYFVPQKTAVQAENSADVARLLAPQIKALGGLLLSIEPVEEPPPPAQPPAQPTGEAA